MRRVTAPKVVALIPPGAVLAILLLFAVGESASGDWSGLGHLIQAIPIGLLMWLGWKRPVWGGLLFLIMGLMAALYFTNALRGPEGLAPFLIIIAPLLLAGLLLIGASQLEHKTI